MRMSSCTTLPGATHASIEYSPVALIRFVSFVLAVVEACALPPLKFKPQPPTHFTLPERCRSIAGIDAARVERRRASARDRVAAGLPRLELVQRDHVRLVAVAARGDRAFVERERLARDERGVDLRRRHAVARTAWIAACIAFASVAQLVRPAVVRLVAQAQHEARVRRIVEIHLGLRGLVRDLHGVGVVRGPSAKNGCCFTRRARRVAVASRTARGPDTRSSRTARHRRPGSSCSSPGRARPAARARSCAPLERELAGPVRDPRGQDVARRPRCSRASSCGRRRPSSTISESSATERDDPLAAAYARFMSSLRANIGV